MAKNIAKQESNDGGKEQALLGLIDETVALFLRLQKDIARTDPEGEFAGARRGLLLALYGGGPKTVPQMARARGASRQYIQMVVNPLAEQGHLEFINNPAHKRSRLVQLTDQGKSAVEQRNREEMEFLKSMELDIEQEDLLSAADTLGQVRKLMESERWQRALEG